MRVYNIFISHSWKHDDDYDRLVALLDKEPYFMRHYKNYSVPKDDPIHSAGNDSELMEAIKNQIRPASVILIPAGIYTTCSEWINEEIKIAKYFQKPIIAIEPWGAEKTSTVVKKAADEHVKWNTDSIVDAIKRLAK